MLMNCDRTGKGSLADPFGEEAAEKLLSALIAYLREFRHQKEQTVQSVLKLLAACDIDENCANETTTLDRIFEEVRRRKQ